MTAPDWLLKAAREDRLPKLPEKGDLNATVRGSWQNGEHAESKPAEAVAFTNAQNGQAVTWGQIVAQEQRRLDEAAAFLEHHPSRRFGFRTDADVPLNRRRSV